MLGCCAIAWAVLDAGLGGHSRRRGRAYRAFLLKAAGIARDDDQPAIHLFDAHGERHVVIAAFHRQDGLTKGGGSRRPSIYDIPERHLSSAVLAQYAFAGLEHRLQQAAATVRLAVTDGGSDIADH